jgi:DNA-binding XRE family transcriptional regulator
MPTKGDPPTFVARPKPVLVIEARRVLGLNREGLGRLLGSSKRTVARWEVGESTIYEPQLFDLARAVYPRDAALAEELGLAGGATLEKLGIVPPPAPPAPPAPEIPGHVLVDAIVCAAADALKAVPETVRASVLAAFRRARELRMTVEDVENALTKRR